MASTVKISSSVRPARSPLARLRTVFFAAIAAALVARLFYKASLDSGDFLVYWRASHAWLTGSAFPYGVIDPTVPGFVFKYPPWILPLFTPIGLVGPAVAKAVWAILELGALVYSITKIIRLGVRPFIALFAALCLWWIWQEQFWSGQITIFMLAAALWISPSPEDPQVSPSQRPLGHAFVAYLFTAKAFSVVTLFGKWRELTRPRTLLAGALLAILPSLLVLVVLRAHDPTHSIGIGELFQRFFASANSGGVSLGENVIRGPINHGFTAAILRSLHIDSSQSRYDIIVATGLSLFFGVIWALCSRGLDGAEKWMGWLALGAIVHPLAWDHTFVLVYPICALSLERAARSRRFPLVALAFLGLAFVGLLVPNIVGTEIVKPFDFIGAKSWGVLFSATALVLSKAPIARASRLPAEAPAPSHATHS